MFWLRGRRSRRTEPVPFSKPGQAGSADNHGEKPWQTTTKNAEVAHFPIYNLRHVFCMRLSWVAVIRARKPSDTTNWGWWSRCGRIWKKPTSEFTAGEKYYVFMTFPPLPRFRRRRSSVNERKRRNRWRARGDSNSRPSGSYSDDSRYSKHPQHTGT